VEQGTELSNISQQRHVCALLSHSIENREFMAQNAESAAGKAVAGIVQGVWGCVTSAGAT
jgi:hypothetical protein